MICRGGISRSYGRRSAGAGGGWGYRLLQQAEQVKVDLVREEEAVPTRLWDDLQGSAELANAHPLDYPSTLPDSAFM